MYKIIKNVIESKDYKLEDILYKISKMYVEDRITEKEKDELDKLAREKAKAENSYDLQKQLDNIFERLEALENRTEPTENQTEETENNTETVVPTEPTETVEPTEKVEEYVEYVQPTGAHDSYKIGDKVKFKDKNYICKMDGCVWSPETYPLAWELIEDIVEKTEETQETVEESEE